MRNTQPFKRLSIPEVVIGVLGDQAVNIIPIYPLVKMRRCPGCLETLAEHFKTLFGIWPGKN
jgi:hypothetical protein